MMRHSLRHFIIASATIIIALGIDSGAIAQMPPSSVRVDPARMENVQETRRVTGNLRAITRSRVGTLEEGRVIDFPVIEGQHVKRGEVLAKLD